MIKSRIGVAMDVLSGTGAAAQLGNSLLERSVRRAVLVTGHRTQTLAIFKAICAGLNEAGIAWTSAARENRFPTVDDVEAVAAHIREKAPDIVIAVGGGSVLDLTKPAVIVAAEGSPAERHALIFTPPNQLEFPKLSAPKLPIVAVPTTFSGSEGNVYGNIRGGETKVGGRAFGDPKVLASIVVLDPIAGEEQTPRQAVSSALNAFAHFTDAVCVRQRTPFTDALAGQGLYLLCSALPVLASHPADSVARVDAQWGSLFGGLAIQHSFVGFHHALSHALVDFTGNEHGVANAMVLPYSIGWHLRHLKGRDVERLNAVLPADWSGILSRTKAAVEIPESLRAAGVPQEQLSEIAEHAVKHITVPNEILSITEKMLHDVLMDAYEGRSVR